MKCGRAAGQQARILAHERPRVVQQGGLAPLDEGVALSGLRRAHRTGDRINVAALVERVTRGDERARARASGLDDDRRDAQAADDAVAALVVEAVRLGPGRIFADDRAGKQDIAHEGAVLRRIAHIRASGEHRDRQTACAERAAMRRRVVAERHAADRDKAGLRQLRADRPGDLHAVARRLPRADDRDARHSVEIRPPAADIQHDRRILNLPQAVRVGGVRNGQDADVLACALRDDLFGLVRRFVAQQLDMLPPQTGTALREHCAVRGVNRLGRAHAAQHLRAQIVSQASLEG